MHVDETIIITVEDKRTETTRMPCKNSATSGGSKHKALVLNCITLLSRVQKLIFEQHPLSETIKEGNKVVEDTKQDHSRCNSKSGWELDKLLSSIGYSHHDRI